MKKILYIVCCCLLSAPVLASYWKMGSSGACIVHANASGAHDVFYYCGKQDKNCAGNNDASYDSRHWQEYGEGVDTGNSYGKLWCCNGLYVRAKDGYEDKFIIKEESKTISFQDQNGKCTYVVKTDVCGKVIDEPCKEPTPCEAGEIRREKTGDCVKPCTDGYAFESETSNNCIKCDTTTFSGIVFQGNNGDNSFCRICDKNTKFFDKNSGECKEKDQFTKYSSERMAKCFMCSDDNFKSCLDLKDGKKTNEKNCPIE